MRPNVTTQIQRTKGVRQPVDDAARVGQEVASGILAGIAAPVTITGQFNVTTPEAEAPAEVDEMIAARTLMMKAMSKAHYTVRDNGDGTFTHSYRFEREND